MQAYYRQRVMFAKKRGLCCAAAKRWRHHDGDKDVRRDAMFVNAGYWTVSWQSKAKPDLQAICAALMTPAAGVAGNASRQAAARYPIRRHGQ